MVDLLVKAGADPKLKITVQKCLTLNLLEYALLFQKQEDICQLLYQAGACASRSAWSLSFDGSSVVENLLSSVYDRASRRTVRDRLFDVQLWDDTDKYCTPLPLATTCRIAIRASLGHRDEGIAKLILPEVLKQYRQSDFV
jgi:hypothetical protein